MFDELNILRIWTLIFILKLCDKIINYCSAYSTQFQNGSQMDHEVKG